MKIQVAPSLLASDFSRLGEEIDAVEAAGVDMLHMDIMDGHFVPNISFGVPVLQALRERTRLPFDVHLMISDPMAYIGIFAGAGADSITFHLEAAKDPEAVIREIRSHGRRAALSLKPATGLEALKPLVPLVDMVLLMTVEPGFGGQGFMADMLPKIRELREYAPELDIQVDGGIMADTAPLVREAGANVLVAGTAIFGQADYAQAVRTIRG